MTRLEHRLARIPESIEHAKAEKNALAQASRLAQLQRILGTPASLVSRNDSDFSPLTLLLC
jgi:hypothetical protein